MSAMGGKRTLGQSLLVSAATGFVVPASPHLADCPVRLGAIGPSSQRSTRWCCRKPESGAATPPTPAKKHELITPSRHPGASLIDACDRPQRLMPPHGYVERLTQLFQVARIITASVGRMETVLRSH